MTNLIQIILLFGLVTNANASQPTGVGHVAQNMLEPVTFFSDFIQTGCFVIGGSFLFASLIKYFEHRRSPLMVPISTVIFLFVAGLILLLLPFLAFFVEGGVPYSFLVALQNK